MPSACSASLFHTLPMPASSRWSSRASPTSRPASARGAARAARGRRRGPSSIRSCAEPAQHGVQRELGRRQQLQHRPVEEHADVLRGAQHEPGPRRASAPALTGPVHVPAAASCAGASAPSGRWRTSAAGACRGPRWPPAARRPAAPGCGRGACRGCGVSTVSAPPASGARRRAASSIVSPSGIASRIGDRMLFVLGHPHQARIPPALLAAIVVGGIWAWREAQRLRAGVAARGAGRPCATPTLPPASAGAAAHRRLPLQAPPATSMLAVGPLEITRKLPERGAARGAAGGARRAVARVALRPRLRRDLAPGRGQPRHERRLPLRHGRRARLRPRVRRQATVAAQWRPKRPRPG